MATKRKTAKKTTAKRKNVKNLSQTHGKVEEFQPTTLDQIWGDTGITTYGTMNEKEYEARVDDMNMSDLQAHASTVGIIPVDNRNMLRERLLREFRKHVSSYQRPISPPNTQETINKEAEKILSEGR
tara:strand:- start:139 stop:519 length:381 start_codon:yes stop_codon:yes gene_type:complete